MIFQHQRQSLSLLSILCLAFLALSCSGDGGSPTEPQGLATSPAGTTGQGQTAQGTPAIDIEKATNGEDADDPPGPTLTVGDPVDWTYVVTNTGDVDLTDVQVTDDQGVTVSCPGDTLAVGESMTCTANGTVELGQYANIGTAAAAANGNQVSDSDPSHYFGEEQGAPAIDIEKATNGEDADDPPGPTLTVGDPVDWTYVVTNTGDVDLTDVQVTDDQGVAVSCPGDTLAVGESMTCTANGTVELGQYANIGTAEAAANGNQVSDSDPSHYLGEVPSDPPDCESAAADPDRLWPPNHKFVAINVLVSDPNGDPVAITIDSIFQDEPVDSTGDGSHVPDGSGVGTETAEVRAERMGSSNGRVYHIAFTADDGQGGVCFGEVLVGVPKSQGGGEPVDDGSLFDSTVIP